MAGSSDFNGWFETAAGFAPHPWQQELASEASCTDRLVRVPTGMGKTLGVLAAWSYHRLVRGDASWPRRLVWCLPMRTLVEQTVHVARGWLDELGLLREQDPASVQAVDRVGVYSFMGGTPLADWHLGLEREAVLVGTQDMLLSRALNRGYGTPRARWPMEFALLHRDALWVFDEVQLMDVGLTTSVQLQAFRGGDSDVAPLGAPAAARSWWMSATLQPEWIATQDYRDEAAALAAATLSTTDADAGTATVTADKPLEVQRIPAAEDADAARWADLVSDVHDETAPGPWGKVTLAVANTVDDATALHAALLPRCGAEGRECELLLVHSRFRPNERRDWRKSFLSRDACSNSADRIIVSTQVVEAGVDLSATALITQLAPWPSLVQRFGRAARYGGGARVVVVDRQLSEKDALPYDEADLTASRTALDHIESAAIGDLNGFEHELRKTSDPLLSQLYRYGGLHELSRRELAELFDNGPDLTGADIDVSRFIRSGNERDVQVWWWECDDDGPDGDLQPRNEALCPVPCHLARGWLFASRRLKEGCRAWVWDYLEGRWRRPGSEQDIYPGRVVLVDASWGGYRADLGWTGRRPVKGEPPIDTVDTSVAPQSELRADLAQDTEARSEADYKTIATHGREVAEEATVLAKTLGLDDRLVALLDLAGRVHDLGKAHPAFQNAIRREMRDPRVRERIDLAKAPDTVWRRGRAMFGDRRGLRHELASSLALLSVLSSFDPWHGALLGPLRGYEESGALELCTPREPACRPAGPLAEELAELDPLAFDLVLYLTCCHHGKVRVSWQATPDDERLDAMDVQDVPIRGLLEGDQLPSILAATGSHKAAPTPAVELHLDVAGVGLSARHGASWRERVGNLRSAYGDTALAYLEAVLRTADVRASRRATRDPLLEESS